MVETRSSDLPQSAAVVRGIDRGGTMRALAACSCLSLLLGCVAGSSPEPALFTGAAAIDSVPVRLRDRTVYLSPATTRAFWAELSGRRDSARHALLWLARDPDSDTRERLRAMGVTVLAPHEGRIWWARVSRSADSSRLSRALGTLRLGALEARDRVEPSIWAGDFRRFALLLDTGRMNYVLNTNGTLNVAVAFHDEVSIRAIEEAMRAHARSHEPLSRTIHRGMVDSSAMRRLAALDIVRWIGAGLPPLRPDLDKVRQAVNANGVQNVDLTTGVPQGLGGAGIQVGVFDEGIDQSHDDFAGRVIVTEAPSSWHGTAVAGVLAGSGVLSTGTDTWGKPNGGTPFQWRGIAPQAQLLDLNAASSFYSSHLIGYITANGLDISNHSYSFSQDGIYRDLDAWHDIFIRGDGETPDGIPVPPRLYVYSSGNSGTQPAFAENEQSGYFALNKQGKNGLFVGNYDVAQQRIHATSSLGPAHDGRIKPDVVAPGTDVRSTGFCREGLGPDTNGSCVSTAPPATERRDYYRTETGSSLAAPVVTGMLALALQQHVAMYGALTEANRPRPSTLRAIAIHSARDISGPVWFPNEDAPVQAFPGPDFVTGFGLVDVAAAVKLVAEQRTIEDFIPATCSTRTYVVNVPPGNRLRVTLAWDDLYADLDTPASTPKLVNDLDLELLAPSTTVHYPFLLDQQILSETGVPLSDAEQLCDMAVQVKRQVVPTEFPNWVAPGNAANVNDPIPAGALQKAGRGKDHLNNVEQVAPEVIEPGDWTITVTGFRVRTSSPQTFSLVITQRPLIVFAHGTFCEWFRLCPAIFPRNLCARYPKLCEPRQIPIAPGPLPIRFEAPEDRFVLPLDRVCLFVIDCPPCAADGRCAVSQLTLPRLPAPMTVEVWARGGRRVYSDRSRSLAKRVQFQPRRGEEYVLVIGPLSEAQVGQRFAVPISAAR